MVILGKSGSLKASLHYFTFFFYFVKLVIYTFMGHNLTSIDILNAWMSLNLLVLYVTACCVRSDI